MSKTANWRAVHTHRHTATWQGEMTNRTVQDAWARQGSTGQASGLDQYLLTYTTEHSPATNSIKRRTDPATSRPTQPNQTQPVPSGRQQAPLLSVRPHWQCIEIWHVPNRGRYRAVHGERYVRTAVRQHPLALAQCESTLRPRFIDSCCL